MLEGSEREVSGRWASVDVLVKATEREERFL